MKLVFVALFMLVSGYSLAQATDLIISEYIEGSSNNKYIELYNGTSASINLANYELRLYANGSATVSNTQALTGTLAVGATIVFKNSAATIYAGAATATAVCNFNGDDAVALFKTTTSSFVDIVGNIGCDPGTAWSGTNSTLDKTLVRIASVCSGVTSDPTNSPCNFPTIDSEWSQSNIDVITNLGTHTMSCVACSPSAAPTTNATGSSATPSCTTTSLSWTNGNGNKRIVVVSLNPIIGTPSNQINYTAGSYGSGSTIASGEYVVYNGNANSTTISGLSQSTTYYFAVFEYNSTLVNCNEGYLITSPLTGSFTTISGCGPVNPEILGILANSCDAAEGLNEFFVFQNGTSALALSSMTITYPTLGFDYCNSGCGTNTLLNNASAISSLNSAAGCSLFTFADPIPAGAMVVVFTGNPPTAPPNFSAQCGQLYHAVFCNNPSNTGGRFANSGTGTRTLSVNFGSSTDAVTYDLAAMSNVDGEYISYDYPGNPSYTVLTNCAGPLAVTLTKWEGKATSEGNLLSWTIESSENNSYFIVRKSVDGIEFQDLEIVNDQHQNQETHYSILDREVRTDICYYQLMDVDYNGIMSASPVIAVQNKNKSGEFSIINGYVVYNDWSEIIELSICDATGKVVLNSQENEVLQNNRINLNSGLYFIQASTKSGKIITQKLFVNGTF